MKTCTKCNTEKPVSCFGVSRDKRLKKPGLKSWCRDCESEYQRGIYANNPQKQRERKRIYKERYAAKVNAARRTNRLNIYISESARRYRTTKERIKALLDASCCGICGREIKRGAKNVHLRPNIDHCHKSNKIRGVLCGYCNNLLGRSQDNPATLRKAADYLERF